MKDTNAIEKALQVKINKECQDIVDKFIADLDKLTNKYGGGSFYYIRKDASSKANYLMLDGTSGVSSVLDRMVRENYGNAMLKYKSQELIKKLDLI
jgi:hypothetical protein